MSTPFNGQQNVEEYFELVAQEIEIFRKAINQRSIESFIKNLSEAAGPIVFIGIGASEINARRAQHLFNSIGKPSISPKVSDLLHGGIGGLGLSNSIVIFSKSGLTDEIIQLISFLDTVQYKIFLVTENDKLGQVEVNLYYQVMELGPSIESDLNRVLPTTSNLKVNMLIDLLAKGLQNQMNSLLTIDKHHPGGTLGKLSTTILSDVIEEDWKLRYLLENSTLNEILEQITKSKIGGISITNGKTKLIGIVSDGDIRRILANNNLGLKGMEMTEVIYREPRLLRVDMTLEKAIELVNNNRNLSFFPIVNEHGDFVATVSSREILTIRLSSI